MMWVLYYDNIFVTGLSRYDVSLVNMCLVDNLESVFETIFKFYDPNSANSQNNIFTFLVYPNLKFENLSA